MGSSPEMEGFGVSDADFEYMMDPTKRRFKQSKKKTIYGVFASDDSDSENERSGFGGRESGLKRKGANYSAPISFVSGGVKVGSKDVDKPEENEPDQISDDEEEKNFTRGLRDSDSDSPPDRHQPAVKRHKPSLSFGSGRQAAMATAGTKSGAGGFGSWERHTRGIGMKLLEQMGYQPGKGLGSEGQGITTPVQATQRTGKAAVGYFGKETVPGPRRGTDIPETKAIDQPSGPRYKKKSTLTTTSKFAYKTIDEVVASVSPAYPGAPTVKRHGMFLENSEMSKVKVIDMTSQEQRVYTGYEEALASTARRSQRPDIEGIDGFGPDSTTRQTEKRHSGQLFDCASLRHNLDLIVRASEEEIRKLDRTSRFEEDHGVALEHEIEKLTETVKTESVSVTRLRTALDWIEKFESDVQGYASPETSGALAPDDIIEWMDRIREECADLPELPLLLASMAKPMLDASLGKWKPLSNPTYCFQLLTKWRDSLRNASAFDLVLDTSWLSSIRRAIVNDWDPRDVEALLAVLETWRPLLPEHMLEKRILNELVLPKLHEAVTTWNPLTDTIPIHTWLHPWLPWFGGTERLTTLHEIVLHKLSTCLTNWHPSDGSAHSVLTPWRSVVPVGSMAAFLNRHVVPKLGLTLQQFKLNPAAQNMDVWKWVMRWVDLLGPAVLVNQLEQHFWPRWVQVLCNWLQQGVEARQRGEHEAAGQVYQEVGRWYAGWKGQIPPECMEYASVKDTLTKALAMMERAMRGLPPQEPGTVRSSTTSVGPAPFSTTTTSSISNPRLSGGLQSNFTNAPLVAPPPITLRKQVEQIAAQRGLTFHPIPNRLFEGQQVYRFERLHVFFDRNVSFLHNPNDGNWHPVSFAELLAKAQY